MYIENQSIAFILGNMLQFSFYLVKSDVCWVILFAHHCYICASICANDALKVVKCANICSIS